MPSPYVKDAFHDYVASGNQEAVNPAKMGTKAAAHYRLDVPAGGSKTVRLRLGAENRQEFVCAFRRDIRRPIADADEFYERITPPFAERG